MPRITKGMIAAAYSELNCIHELATEPDAFRGQHATYQAHARSASNYLDVLRKAGQPMPDFIAKSGIKYFKAMGWSVV